jgi:hypothetical protein
MKKIPFESKILFTFITCVLASGSYIGINKLKNDPQLKSNKHSISSFGYNGLYYAPKGVVYPFSKN